MVEWERMELKEATAVLELELGNEGKGEKLCKYEPEQYKAGALVIDGIQGVGHAAILRDNMVKSGVSEPKKPKQAKLGPDVLRIKPKRFPYQTHHLIPEKKLKSLKITAFLTDSPPKGSMHPHYILGADTDYDTNDARNGYFMPFARTTHQWQKYRNSKSKQRIAYEVMRRTELQLHQGKHSSANYAESSTVEISGYHEKVKELLDKVSDRIEDHVKTCKDCKGKGKRKGRIVIRPLGATPRFVHRVSDILKKLIVSNRIFVSRRAADYFLEYSKGGVLEHPKCKLLQHPEDEPPENEDL